MKEITGGNLMRIGAVRQQIKLATNDNKLTIECAAIYGGQAYRINNFAAKFRLVESLLNLSLIDPELFTDDLKKIFESIRGKDTFELSASEYSKLNTFFTQINATLPVMQRTIDVFSPDQEEQIINIKLPDTIESIADLSSYNTRLSKVFNKFGINETNSLRFKGFDNGTEWYQILIENVDFFKWFVVAIGIAWSCIKIRKEWFESEIARLTLKSLKEEDLKKKELKKNDAVVKKVLETKIEEDVETAFKNGLSTFNKGDVEVKNQFKNAIEAMIEEMDRGTEFHLSLNPPDGIEEIEVNGLTRIDYSQVYEINPIKNEPQKELPDSSSPEE